MYLALGRHGKYGKRIILPAMRYVNVACYFPRSVVYGLIVAVTYFSFLTTYSILYFHSNF